MPEFTPVRKLEKKRLFSGKSRKNALRRYRIKAKGLEGCIGEHQRTAIAAVEYSGGLPKNKRKFSTMC